MLKSLLSTAIGNLAKDKAGSALHLMVLAGVITFALLLLVNILYESSYDRYHVKADNLYRIVSNINDGDNEYMWDISQASLAPELLRRYPEVRNAARFSSIGTTVFRKGNRSFEEKGFYTADASVFDMFTYRFLGGDPGTALIEPFSMVVTEKIARKYFGSVEKALNQALKSENGESYFIRGVMENVPPNSHFTFDALISSRTGKGMKGGWANFSTHTYIELPSNYRIGRMCNHLKSLAREKLHPIADQLEMRISYQLQPLTRIHQSLAFGETGPEAGSRDLLYIGSAVLLALLVASLVLRRNATMRSAESLYGDELKERMGVRRGLLILQLIAESVCITTVALVVSVVMVYSLLPVMNNLLNKQIPFSMLCHSSVLLTMLGVFVSAACVGALYPSWYLPRMNMLRELRGDALKKEEIYLV